MATTITMVSDTEDGMAAVVLIAKDRYVLSSEAPDGALSREQIVHLAMGIIEALATEDELRDAADLLGY